MQAVDRKAVDFTMIGADGAYHYTRTKVKNSVVAFAVGPVSEVGWAFRKEDVDLQEAAKTLFESQRKVGSQFDAIWQEVFGITLSDFTLFMTTLLES